MVAANLATPATPTNQPTNHLKLATHPPTARRPPPFPQQQQHQAFSWGLNNYGQLGVGDRESKFAVTPLKIADEEIVQARRRSPLPVALSRAIHHVSAWRPFRPRVVRVASLGGVRRSKSSSTHATSKSMMSRPRSSSVSFFRVQISAGIHHSLLLTKSGRAFALGAFVASVSISRSWVACAR